MTASPGCERGAGDHLVQRDGAEAGSGEVEAADQLAELGELAADDLDAGQLCARREALADLGCDRSVGPVHGEVVHHRQRACPDADHVVDVHRDAVDADGVPAAELLGDQELGADAVGGQGDSGALVDADDVGVVAACEHLAALAAARARRQGADEGADGVVGIALADPRARVGVPAHSPPPPALAAETRSGW